MKQSNAEFFAMHHAIRQALDEKRPMSLYYKTDGWKLRYEYNLPKDA